MSLNDALLALRSAHDSLADVAYSLAHATFALSPHHPTQTEIKRLTDIVHQLAHDLQALRLKMASGPA